MNCDKCGEETKEAYRLGDDTVCEKCFQDAVSEAEYAYDSMLEDKATGN